MLLSHKNKPVNALKSEIVFSEKFVPQDFLLDFLKFCAFFDNTFQKKRPCYHPTLTNKSGNFRDVFEEKLYAKMPNIFANF